MPVLWPFRPVPSSTETLSWRTDVMGSAASEMRVSLREARQAITYSYAARDPKMAQMEWLVREYPLGDWYVPLWFEATDPQPIGTADTVLSVNTDAHYFAGGFLAIWGGCDNVVVCEIDAVADGAVTLTAAVGTTFASAFVMPVRTAWMDGGLRFSRIRERGISDVAVTFQVRDSDEPADTPYTQYLDLDLVKKCGTVEPLAAAVAPDYVAIDNAFGPVVLQSNADFIASRHSMIWRLQDNLWTRRKWLHYLRGRDRPFWLADWQKDFTLAAPITAAGTNVTVVKIAPVVASLVGRHILIDDGTATPREITAAIDSGANHVLTIAPLGRDVSVARIGLLRMVRLDSDVIEFAHVHGFYTQTRIPLVEVPE